MKKVLFFDAGPIITLVLSRLAWILEPQRKQFGGDFYITPAVHYEVIERAMSIPRFRFEALQVKKMVRDGTIRMYDGVPKKRSKELISLANSVFTIGRKKLDVMQAGEIESVASACEVEGSGVVMDERTLRLFIERKDGMKELLERRFHKDVGVDTKKLDLFSSQLKGVTIIRSVELIGIAYKLGLLDAYLPDGKGARATLLDAVLFAAKYNGCSVTSHEVHELKQMLLK